MYDRGSNVVINRLAAASGLAAGCGVVLIALVIILMNGGL